MSRRINIVTPENIEISYELAGVGSRFVAVLIDHLIQIAAIILIGLGISYVNRSFIHSLTGGQATLFVEAVAVLAIFAIFSGYFVFFELIWAGRTPGKRIVGLQLIRDGGYAIDPYSSFVRNIVRLVDLMPPLYGIGIISIFISSDYKRLGDYAAGTLVIKVRAPASLDQKVRGPASPAVVHFMTMVRNIDSLTADEFAVIRRFVQRRHELDIAAQAQIGMKLALPIVQKLKVEAPIHAQLQYADLLEAIERRYVEEHGVL